MWTLSLFGAKNFGFFEIYDVTRGEGIEQVRSFCGQGGGRHFFAILCGRPLWTALIEL